MRGFDLKILYISDRQSGGIVSHVKCLTACLPDNVEHYVIGVDGDEPFAGKSGHDWREWFQIRRVIKVFKPDVIHFHTNPLFMELYVKLFFRGGVVCSIHTPSVAEHPQFSRRLVNWAAEPCYWLPVSDDNWRSFKTCYPKAKGEVFYNPIRIEEGRGRDTRLREVGNGFVVGMVGRNADQKDWPSFHQIESIIQTRLTQTKMNHLLSTSTSSLHLSFLNAGEREICNGREAIAKMNLFVMTSKHEQLPTTVLECFLLGTPICGFLPAGGTSDILQYSSGPVRDAFIKERSCEKLADIVMDLMAHPEKRQALVEDGRQILEGHFDAEKNVRGRLMEIYESGRGEWER